MKLAVGSDHAGYPLKVELVPYLKELGHEVDDLGTHTTAPADYPDYAEKVGLAVKDGRAERGLVICGSGVGASIAANKLPGVRAGLCHDSYSAKQGVEHDDMNVLVLGARIVGTAVARDLVRNFLEGKYSKEERHQRRLDKVLAIEKRYSASGAKG